jgi:hypothetical protein
VGGKFYGRYKFSFKDAIQGLYVASRILYLIKNAPTELIEGAFLGD